MASCEYVPSGRLINPISSAHAQFAPFIQSCFIGRISYLAPTSPRIIGSAELS